MLGLNSILLLSLSLRVPGWLGVSLEARGRGLGLGHVWGMNSLCVWSFCSCILFPLVLKSIAASLGVLVYGELHGLVGFLWSRVHGSCSWSWFFGVWSRFVDFRTERTNRHDGHLW